MKKLLFLLILAGVAAWYYLKDRNPSEMLSLETLMGTPTNAPAPAPPEPPPPKTTKATKPTPTPKPDKPDPMLRRKAQRVCQAYEKSVQKVYGKLYPANEHFHGEHNEAFEQELKNELRTVYNEARKVADAFKDERRAGAIAHELVRVMDKDVQRRQQYKTQVKQLYLRNGITNYYARPRFVDFDEKNDLIFTSWDAYRAEQAQEARTGIELLKEQIR